MQDQCDKQFNMSLFGCIVSSCISVAVLKIHLQMRIGKKQLKHILVIVTRGDMQGRSSTHTLTVDINVRM